ncbi:hypothetical protein LCM00_04410 [Bacillus infantis]|uniref:hypothetical protein n=1 Tax=Bacillus infantis TaxID=324767 RepID=UPI001CD36D27|nr:hypothetical protein [Bacillus infantis]MCA1038743.1 hypothetical protein [Bacillus infantis]
MTHPCGLQNAAKTLFLSVSVENVNTLLVVYLSFAPNATLLRAQPLEKKADSLVAARLDGIPLKNLPFPSFCTNVKKAKSK